MKRSKLPHEKKPTLLRLTHNPPGELSDQYALSAGGISGQTNGDNMCTNFVSPPNRMHECVMVLARVPALNHPTKGTVPGELNSLLCAAEGTLLLENGQDVSFAQSGLARGFATIQVVPWFVYLSISQHSHELVVFLASE